LPCVRQQRHHCCRAVVALDGDMGSGRHAGSLSEGGGARQGASLATALASRLGALTRQRTHDTSPAARHVYRALLELPARLVSAERAGLGTARCPTAKGGPVVTWAGALYGGLHWPNHDTHREQYG
jgi:hypothetical protein